MNMFQLTRISHNMDFSRNQNACCAETNAELPQVGIFFRTEFPSMGIFINKKSWKSKKLRPSSVQLLKLI